MVKVLFDNYTGKELQDFVIRDLKASIDREIGEMKCSRCGSESKVHVALLKNKLNGMNIKVDACCEEFRQEIVNALMPSYSN